jgi:hypothetical protein
LGSTRWLTWVATWSRRPMVVSSISGERMGEGPGKGETDLTEETDNSEDMTEMLAMDRVIFTGEVIVREGGG